MLGWGQGYKDVDLTNIVKMRVNQGTKSETVSVTGNIKVGIVPWMQGAVTATSWGMKDIESHKCATATAVVGFQTCLFSKGFCCCFSWVLYLKVVHCYIFSAVSQTRLTKN